MKRAYLRALVFFVVILPHIVLPGIDPPWWFTGDYGPFADEGYKTLHAKNLVLFGSEKIDSRDSYKAWSSTSPVTHLLFTVVFSLFGTGYIQARLINMLTSIITIILLYWLVKKRVNRKTALITSSMLGINFTYLVYTKTALLEPVAVLFLLLSLWLLLRKNIASKLLSVIPFALAYLTKPIAIIFTPVFLYVAYAMGRKHISSRQKLFKAMIILLGVAVISSIIFWDIILQIFKYVMVRNPGNPQMFLKLLIQFFYQDFFTVNTFLLIGFLGYLSYAAKKLLRQKTLRDYDILMLFWVLGGLFVLVLQTYRPPRYFIMIIVPMCALAARFITTTQSSTRCDQLIHASIAAILCLHSYFLVRLNLMMIVWLFLCTMIVLFALYLPRTSISKNTLFYAYMIFNIIIILVWFANPQFTLIESSKTLGEIVEPDAVILGINWAPALCMEIDNPCYHVSGKFNEHQDVFRELDVDYFIADNISNPDYSHVAFIDENIDSALDYKTTFTLGRFKAKLFAFNATAYYKD